LAILETWKGEKVYNIYEGLWAKHHKKILKATWTSLNLKSVFSMLHIFIQSLMGKKEVKVSKPKIIPKTLIPSSKA
jgi:hypothetical protein